MKLFLYSLLVLGLASPIIAADATAPKKEKDAAKTEAKAKTDKPKEKAPKEASAKDKALADSLSPAQKSKLMGIVNTGDEKELSSLPKVGPIRAAAIKAGRPFKEPTDLLNVMGIGEATFAAIVNHAKADFPAPEAKPKAAKKDDTKKSDEKAKK